MALPRQKAGGLARKRWNILNSRESKEHKRATRHTLVCNEIDGDMNDDGALDNQQQDDQTAPATHLFYILLFYILSTIHYFSKYESLATNSMDDSTFAPRCHSTVFIRAVSFSWICSILFLLHVSVATYGTSICS
jgi:hypothetical protein